MKKEMMNEIMWLSKDFSAVSETDNPGTVQCLKMRKNC